MNAFESVLFVCFNNSYVLYRGGGEKIYYFNKNCLCIILSTVTTLKTH